MNMPLVLLNRRRRGGGFSPATLFALAEPGVWYDPSDFSTLFQDSAGTTPVTAVEQSVGLVLDKSKGLVLGPELRTATAVVGGGWTQVGGVITASGTAGTDNVSFTLSAATVAGRFYEVQIPNTMPGGSFYVDFGSGTGSQVGALGSNVQRIILTCTAPGGVIRVGRWTGTPSGTIGPISVKELPGNHATQSTSASRPVLSARYNLLTATERFDDAGWQKIGSTVSANNAVAPNGTTTADKLVEDVSTGVHRVQPNPAPTIANGAAHISLVYAKAAERTRFRITENATTGAYATFDVSTGTVVDSGLGGTGAIISVGDGWYRCEMRFTSAGTSGRIDIILVNGSSVSYTGDGTSGILIWGADLRVTNDGTGIPVYQRVNTSTDYDTVGFPPYLRFDGSDDFLVTNTITPGTDKAQVFAGVRKLSDAAFAMVAETGTGLQNGSVFLAAPGGAAANYRFLSRGTGNGDATATTFAAPITNILAGIGDISNDTAIIRANGTQAASSVSDQGTGNYLAYPLYIGRRGGTTLPFNGRLYSLIVRFGANLTADQIAQTETWVNGKTKGY